VWQPLPTELLACRSWRRGGRMLVNCSRGGRAWLTTGWPSTGLAQYGGSQSGTAVLRSGAFPYAGRVTTPSRTLESSAEGYSTLESASIDSASKAHAVVIVWGYWNESPDALGSRDRGLVWLHLSVLLWLGTRRVNLAYHDSARLLPPCGQQHPRPPRAAGHDQYSRYSEPIGCGPPGSQLRHYRNQGCHQMLTNN
jgi:hypothetical protein